MGRLTKLMRGGNRDWVSARRCDSYTSLWLSQSRCADTWTMLKSDEMKLEDFHMSCQHRILRIRRWYDFITECRSCQIQRRRLVFGHVRTCSSDPRYCSSSLLASSVHWRSFCRRIASGLQRKRPRGSPRNTWVRLVQFDIEMTADKAWNAAAECDEWRALRPAAGHVVKWVSEWLLNYWRWGM